MRKAFISALVELAADDPRIVLLTGDLGFGVVEPYRERFPERFYNVGVAEQNMIGIATGLAEAGLIPFAYSIATFATLRPYEFIRNGPAAHRLPVRIVGVGGGVEYGPNGATHHALEDVALMRALPQMTIVAPVDHRQARSGLLATVGVEGPVYFRLGKDEGQALDGFDGSFELGRLEHLARGDDALIVALGPLAQAAMQASALLREQGVSVGVAAIASVQPPPRDALAELLVRVPLAVVVENHGVTGGIGSLVAEIAAEHAPAARIVRVGVASDHSVTGSARYLLERSGLTPEAIASRVARELGRQPSAAPSDNG